MRDPVRGPVREGEGAAPGWRRVEAELRRAPRVEPAAVDRVMDVVRAARVEPARPVLPTPSVPRTLRWLTTRHIALAPVHVLAASLLVAAGIYVMPQGGRYDRAAEVIEAVRAATVTRT